MTMTCVARIALPPVAKRRTGRHGGAGLGEAGYRRGYFGDTPVFTFF